MRRSLPSGGFAALSPQRNEDAEQADEVDQLFHVGWSSVARRAHCLPLEGILPTLPAHFLLWVLRIGLELLPRH